MKKMNKKNTFLKEISILYVEDNKDIREEIAFFLENKVKELFLACDGEEGLALYKKVNPDLVITDITMPKLDGIEMSKEIKTLDKDKDILITSAYNDSKHLIKAIEIGVSDFLIKPLNLMSFYEKLEKCAKTIFMEKDNIEIKNTLEQYKSIVDEREIVSKIDINGLFTYVNNTFLKVFKYKEEELLLENYSILMHPDNKTSFFSDILLEVKKNKKMWRGLVKTLNKENETIYIDMFIKPIFDDNKEIKEFFSISHDVTSLENAKVFLKKQNIKQTINLNEALLNQEQYEKGINASNIVSRTNAKGIITYVNDQFLELSGYSRREVIGRSHNIVRHEDTPMSLFKDMWGTILSGNIWRGTIKNKKKNGDAYFVDSVIIPIFNSKKEIVEYLGIRHDLTKVLRLHEEFEETQREIIYRMGEIGETRSKETGNHVKRVANYSKLLARLYGMNEKDTELLFMASPMHDIGKVGIPDEILNKPGKLTVDEWKIMQTHSEIGYSILENSSREILQTAAAVSYYHHEKWDGSGYPQGLKKEEIPIFGRITAVADVFDALGSDRCYKKAWPLDKILFLFKDESGKHFDPKLVELFFDNIDEFLVIRDEYADK